jgi:hypothetical protein
MVVYPSEYKEFIKLFKNNTNLIALPQHQPWDHKIPLKPGTKSIYRLLYSLLEKELAILREYLKENIKKSFIRSSTSSTGYLILFIPKPKGKLRLYIDYR